MKEDDVWSGEWEEVKGMHAWEGEVSMHMGELACVGNWNG
jgi:hypothetical protein